MYIQTNSNNIAMTGSVPPKKPNAIRKTLNRIKQKVIDVIPQRDFKEGKNSVENLKGIDNSISNPAINRGIMGVTALVTQPLIDFYNHRVDEETRYVSRNRTIAKALAGMGVGMAVRGSCFSLVKNMTDLEGKGKYSKALIPEEWISKFLKNEKMLKNYRNALSTGIAICVMLFTNFLLDAPLATLFTNKFNEKYYAKKALEEKKAEERRVIYA